MSDPLTALRASVDRLANLVRPLGDDEVTKHAYPSAWTIADVVSHVGSSGVIWLRRLDDTLAGRETPDTFAPEVWAEWDAKAPRAKAADGLAVDNDVTVWLERLPSDEQPKISVSMGPITFSWAEVILTRLNEHLLHEWDVAVALNPAATLGADGVMDVVDNLDLVARYTAQPIAPDRTLTVATTEPTRTFEIRVDRKNVDFSTIEPVDDAVLTMPSEAFIRLVYGRLDAEHTPASVLGDAAALDQLRQIFPGP